MADNLTAGGVPVYRDTGGVLREIPQSISDGGSPTGATSTNADLDTEGNAVPTYKPHAYTYDSSGNLITDTVASGNNAWVRTFTWTNGVQSSDSGWVKQ